ncbi:hypothetical protein IFU39_13770 [Paenibacillus sp. CFBP 13594]|uniref:hypothetical protein n=1 Tax=Paenibacillus sp. CFBP 13594 TaxID=2774037 RepID=UPI00177EA5AE|nr:hypothetical protein [Paenibacillus sp. CFBP 13594]MBD8838884.1 hypothetical protein [Paenibacillus sp. CFBP 13594]
MELKNIQVKYNNDSRDNYDSWELFRRSNVEQVYEVVFKRNFSNYGRLLLLGVGNGNDIDINYFEEKFEEVILVDIDEDALNHLISRVKHPEKFTKVVADLSGIAHHFETFEFLNKTSSQVETFLRKIKIEHDLSKIQGKFDCIINCNYTTQLIHPHLLTELDNYKIKPTSGLLQESLELTNKIIIELFNFIHSKLEDKGLFVHSTDKFEISHHAKTDYYSPGSLEMMEEMEFQIHLNTDKLLTKENIIKFQKFALSGSQTPVGIFNVESVRYAPWTFVNTEEFVKHYICAINVYKKSIVPKYNTLKNL